MVTDFSGTSILSIEFVVIDRASANNLGGTFGSARPVWPQVAKSGSKNQNLNGMRWSLDRITNGQVMPTQRLAKSGRAANFEPISGYFSHIF